MGRSTEKLFFIALAMTFASSACAEEQTFVGKISIERGNAYFPTHLFYSAAAGIYVEPNLTKTVLSKCKTDSVCEITGEADHVGIMCGKTKGTCLTIYKIRSVRQM